MIFICSVFKKKKLNLFICVSLCVPSYAISFGDFKIHIALDALCFRATCLVWTLPGAAPECAADVG